MVSLGTRAAISKNIDRRPTAPDLAFTLAEVYSLAIMIVQVAAELQGFDISGLDRQLVDDILSALQLQIGFVPSYRTLSGRQLLLRLAGGVLFSLLEVISIHWSSCTSDTSLSQDL